MRAINLDGDGVHQIKDNEGFTAMLNKLFLSPVKPGISSIIVKSEEEANHLLQLAGAQVNKINDIVSEPSDLMPNKWNLMTIDQAKGLEFETVIAISGRMTENEKYIAYTRALNELYIYDKEVEIPETPDNNEPEVKKIPSNKKPEKRVREKWKSGDKNKSEVGKKKIIIVKGGKATTKVLHDKPSTEQSVPELSLKEFFEAAGLKTVDMRSKGGALWVVGSKEKIGNIIDEAVEKYSVSGAYTKGKAIGYVEGWFTKSKK